MLKPLFPLQYESGLEYDEVEHKNVANIPHEEVSKCIEDDEMQRLFSALKPLSLKMCLQWINTHRDEFSERTGFAGIEVSTSAMLRHVFWHRTLKNLVVKRPLNTIIYLDQFLYTCNEKLEMGGYMWCNARTAQLKREIVLRKYPPGINWVVYSFHYFWHRVCPRVRGFQKIYFAITQGKNRTMHRVEVMGRAYRAGFEVLDEEFRQGDYFLLLHKVKAPMHGDVPSEGPIVRLNRVGKGGAMIGVYKFRTMHPYSEYIQGYIYTHNGLQEKGKFNSDYRVNSWGKLLRSMWLDELPMVMNMLKGEMKLVGVRPLSRQYYELYTPEMQQLRIRTKPGLLPPFYYEEHTPESLEEIQASERRYLEAYLVHPLRTDIRYFFGIMKNILFKHKKSL